MRIPKPVLCLLALLVLAVPVAAVPATALAQSAGDEQYVDPFQGQDDGGGGGGGDNASQTGDSDDTGSTPAETAPSATADTSAQDPGSESGDGTLPRTGIALLPVALLGMFLLSSGAALRRGTKPPSPAFAPGQVARLAPGARPTSVSRSSGSGS